VADFNGDSQPDYLLYNVSTRQTAVWYLNNNVFVSGACGPTDNNPLSRPTVFAPAGTPADSSKK
jgi:hypothetical protein